MQEEAWMNRITMNIGGMSCGHCVGAVTKALKSLDGVDVEQVAIGKATVSYDPSATSPERIVWVLTDEGYAVIPAAR
jgi:copper chaperone